VSSASCNLYDLHDDTGHIGKSVQIQIELGLYLMEMFEQLPPNWLIYEYHSIEDHNRIGPKFTGLSHSDCFIHMDDVDDELEFATALAISNLELWIDSTDADSYRAVWTLAGEL